MFNSENLFFCRYIALRDMFGKRYEALRIQIV